MTVAVHASHSIFRYYSQGVVTSVSGCPTSLDHAIVIVGYAETGSDLPIPDADPLPDDSATCEVTKWWVNCSGGTAGRRL